MRHCLNPTMLIAAALILCLLPAGLSLAAEAPDSLALAADTPSLMVLIGKTVGALALVVGLMLLLLVWIKKMGMVKLTGHSGALINILETRLIAPKKYVTVLQVAGERFVVGITDQQISFLTALKNNDATPETAQVEAIAPVAPFAAFLKTAAGRLAGKERRSGEQETP